MSHGNSCKKTAKVTEATASQQFRLFQREMEKVCKKQTAEAEPGLDEAIRLPEKPFLDIAVAPPRLISGAGVPQSTAC